MTFLPPISALLALLITASSAVSSPLKDTPQKPLLTALNHSGDMTILGGNYIIRYHSSVSESGQVLSLITRQLKYKAENAHMFNGPIPDAVPYVRANIEICSINTLAAQLPGAGAFGQPGSDSVLAIELKGDFSDYDIVNDNQPSAYTGDQTIFTFYVRTHQLLNISRQLELAQIQLCALKDPASITITSLYHSGEISREQAEALILQ